MQDNFRNCLPAILREEGGNSNDAHDPGGRTSRGVIQREWNAWRRTRPGLPDDVFDAPQSEIEAIYRANYWEPYCDRLPAGVDLVFFNTSVNSGRTQAVKELQRALGVSADGMVGLITWNAVETCEDIPSLIRAMCERRRAFYRALKTFKYFGRGWLARTDRIQSAALRMAAASGFAPTPQSTPKAVASDVSKPPMSVEGGAAATTTTTVSAGILQQVQDAASQLTPLADTIHVVKWVLVGLSLIALGLTMYAIWHKSKTNEAMQ